MSDPEPQKTESVERSLKAEIKLYYDLHKSAEPCAPLLIALHGYGAHKRQMGREAQQMAPEFARTFPTVRLSNPAQQEAALRRSLPGRLA